MVRASPFLVATLLTAIVFAGCLGGEADEKVDTGPIDTAECVSGRLCGANAVLDETGRDLRTHLLATDSVPAPTWSVGDVFEQHLFYGNGDQIGEHITTVVVEQDDACNLIATTSDVAARNEVAYDLPVLGCIGRENLATSALGASWGWMYEFPLTDGKTWSGNVDFLYNWNTNNIDAYSFTLKAAYEAKIDTNNGDFPGFIITGFTNDGKEFLRYNYVPAVGWFSHFWMYELSTEAADDVIFHAMSMGTSTGYSGPYYLDESLAYVELFAFVAPLDGAAPLAGSFLIPDGTTYMIGVIAPIACPGLSQLWLVSPANAAEDWTHQYEGDPAPCLEDNGDLPPPGSFTAYWIDQPAESGEWRYASVGAGVWGAVIFLNAVKEVQLQLAAAPAAGA